MASTQHEASLRSSSPSPRTVPTILSEHWDSCHCVRKYILNTVLIMRFSTLPVLIVAGGTFASILDNVGFGAVESQNLLGKQATLLRRQTAGNVTCRLSMGTDIWSSCASVLSQFNITLDYFMAGNPSIGPDCSNFVPGNTYCISIGKMRNFPHHSCVFTVVDCKDRARPSHSCIHQWNVRSAAKLYKHLHWKSVG